MPLPREHLLDELATAYVQALVAGAGATISARRRDYGVDGTIRGVGNAVRQRYFETGLSVDFQLKGTTIAKFGAQSVVFDLKARNYDLIVARRKNATPFYLLLVCFGPDAESWLVADPQALILNAVAFWWTASQPTSRNRSSVRIEIPLINRLTFDAIEDMLARLEVGLKR